MKKATIFTTVATVVVLAIIGAVAFRMSDSANDSHGQSQLTGLEVEPDVADRPILAVIFNNSTEARPPTGLEGAGIVFETVTEGGITRYLAFYQEDMPEEVGPIRSLRPYFLDWAMGFDASFAHVGGSQEALKTSDERDAKSLDQFDHTGPYYRTDDRPAPHNMYANTEQLRSLQQELGHTESKFDTIPRSDENPAENAQANTITIDFSRPEYEAGFRYQASDNSYTRYLAGEPHTDAATAEPISAKNVIIVQTDDSTEATGNGDALLFKDGNVQEVRWEKPRYDVRIKLLNDDNTEVAINRGKSWFAVLPELSSVSY